MDGFLLELGDSEDSALGDWLGLLLGETEGSREGELLGFGVTVGAFVGPRTL